MISLIKQDKDTNSNGRNCGGRSEKKEVIFIAIY
jgi:hypothetical protein